jgi:hypothetical protein
MFFRLTAIALLLVASGPLVSFTPVVRGDHCPVTMTAEDGKAYLVEPGETLATAMGHPKEVARQEEESGACVPEPMESKPEGAVSCRCYEVTSCKGNEARECKRHCRKDLCQCCDI